MLKYLVIAMVLMVHASAISMSWDLSQPVLTVLGDDIVTVEFDAPQSSYWTTVGTKIYLMMFESAIGDFDISGVKFLGYSGLGVDGVNVTDLISTSLTADPNIIHCSISRPLPFSTLRYLINGKIKLRFRGSIYNEISYSNVVDESDWVYLETQAPSSYSLLNGVSFQGGYIGVPPYAIYTIDITGSFYGYIRLNYLDSATQSWLPVVGIGDGYRLIKYAASDAYSNFVPGVWPEYVAYHIDQDPVANPQNMMIEVRDDYGNHEISAFSDYIDVATNPVFVIDPGPVVVTTINEVFLAPLSAFIYNGTANYGVKYRYRYKVNYGSWSAWLTPDVNQFSLTIGATVWESSIGYVANNLQFEIETTSTKDVVSSFIGSVIVKP